MDAPAKTMPMTPPFAPMNATPGGLEGAARIPAAW